MKEKNRFKKYNLRRTIRKELDKGGKILDLCSGLRGSCEIRLDDDIKFMDRHLGDELDGKNLPYGDNTFDIVVFSLAITYFKHQKGIIREIKRVLKKQGKLIITSQNPYRILRRFKKPNRILLNKKQIISLLEGEGFKIIKTKFKDLFSWIYIEAK